MERVNVQHISKHFFVGSLSPRSALQHALQAVSGREPKRRLEALRDISFSISAGEIVGVVGANGSGKSTLLRIVAGILESSGGTVRVSGRTVVLTQLGAGMRERLTMRDNITLICTLFGLSSSETRAVFDSVVDFAELGDFLNTKWYQFSDGMRQRVMFSVAVHTPFDVLLLDEAFAVGDEHFMKKGFEKLHERVSAGASLIMTSHHVPLLQKHCHRVMWIEDGVIRMQGSPTEVLPAYEMNS